MGLIHSFSSPLDATKSHLHMTIAVERDVKHKINQQMSCHMGKPTICIGENKGADQLRGNREADQRLCFRYTDSTIPLLLESKISSL